MFSKGTIKNTIKKLQEMKKAYDREKVDLLKVCISKGNRKIGRVMNVSLPPILTCANCKECKFLCYDVKAVNAYPSVLRARARNLSILERDPEKYFSAIRKALKGRKKDKYFRWHVAGDIPSMEYLLEMVAIAKEFPQFVFWTYTKNYIIVNYYCMKYGKESIPANLSIMFSEWRGMPLINPYNFPVFSVVFRDDENKPSPRWHHYCPGNCDTCLKNHRGCPYGETTYCNEH